MAAFHFSEELLGLCFPNFVKVIKRDLISGFTWHGALMVGFDDCHPFALPEVNHITLKPAHGLLKPDQVLLELRVLALSPFNC